MAGGDGPIDAVFLAIESLTGVSVACRDFRVHSVTVGKDAQGEVLVEVEHQGRCTAAAAFRPTASKRAPRRFSARSTGSPRRSINHREFSIELAAEVAEARRARISTYATPAARDRFEARLA